MKSRKPIPLISLALAVLITLSALSSPLGLCSYADEISEETDIELLKAKKDELTSQVTECKARLEALREQEANVLELKSTLEVQCTLAQEQIEIVSEEIEDYNRLIAKKAEEVDQAKNREAIQLNKYRTRIRAMEENDGYNILALIMSAENFSELLAAIDDMGEIMASDIALQHRYEDAREETEEIKAEYEAEKAVYEEKQAELEDEKSKLESDIKEAEELLESLAEEIEKAKKEYEAAEAAEAAAAATIANVIAMNNAARAAQQAENIANAEAAAAQVQQMNEANAAAAAAGEEAPYTEEQIQEVAAQATVDNSVEASGGLMWPVPCSTRITSRFGTRTDPFTGASSTHSGIDIDGFGNDGAPVVAAAGGTVITASSDSAYGNYVVIDHGGMSTVYAHLSGFAVSAGSTVSQGETIGYLGCTGRATGTHLHFEVYVGNGRVDPASYFSGVSYYNC